MSIEITWPLKEEKRRALKAGDAVSISGLIYAARDAAHQRMYETLGEGRKLPFNLENSMIYYMGPSPCRPGRIMGSAGPTTSGRMDRYTPFFLDNGLRGMIGKGRRSAEVTEAVIRNSAVYFAAVGGAGALLSKSIIKAEIVAYPDLGPEAVFALEVEMMPAIVAIDSMGNNLYDTASLEYRCR